MQLLIFYIRQSRTKARKLAIAEAEHLLADLEPYTLPGGPLGDQKGVFWIAIPPYHLAEATARFPRLGLSAAVDTLEEIPEADWRRDQIDLVRWDKKPWRICRMYEEDDEEREAQSLNQREFVLATKSGLRTVKGYRGDGKRGLQPYDAQMLVNLVFDPENENLLDPFAGAGSIIREAVKSGIVEVFSGDIDPVVRHGLGELGAKHAILDARDLPFADESMDAVVTEPPYDTKLLGIVLDSLSELVRVLKSGKQLLILCADWQREFLLDEMQELGLKLELNLRLNRNTVKSYVLIWSKPDRL